MFVHDPGLRTTALALVAAGTPVKRAARELGISRSTLRYWLEDRPASENFCACHRCWGRMRPVSITEGDYAQLLGIYLGDGHIAELPRTQRLRISCDAKYPQLILEYVGLLRRCFPSSKVGRITADGGSTVVVSMYANHLSCLFPQHGPGKKHHREIPLEDWQLDCIWAQPGRFIRGCFQTDGCSFVNRTGRYEYLSYSFRNRSPVLLTALSWACAIDGIDHRRYASEVRICRRESVSELVRYVGFKT